MPSQIDPTKPGDGSPAVKADLRANLQSAKDEIEALQTGKTDLGHQHLLGDITDAGLLAGLDSVGAGHLDAGFTEPVEDAGDYSSMPFTIADAYNVHRFFTGAQNHIVEFPAGVSADPAAHGKLTSPPANTLTLRRAAGSGVSINGVASDVFIWVVPASGTVEWEVRATNTIELRGDTTAEQLLAGPLDANDQTIERPHLMDVAEGYADAGNKNAAASFDYEAGGWQKCVAIGNITSVAVTNPPASGRVGALTLEIHQDGTGNRTIAWGVDRHAKLTP